MSMDPNRWVGTLPFAKVESNQKKYELDSNRWITTLPKINYNNSSINKKNSFKKYYVTTILFVVGLIFVSVMKNETRNLQKEINNLQASIKTLKSDIHQTTLDHYFITSPENISRLGKKYLESDLGPYKKSQIKQLYEKTKILTGLDETKHKKTFMKKSKKPSNAIMLQITKKIENKKIELKKLQELYTKPEKLPEELKLRVVKRIDKTKTELKKLYFEPKDTIGSKKAQKWVAWQFVKVFLGLPIVPGK